MKLEVTAHKKWLALSMLPFAALLFASCSALMEKESTSRLEGNVTITDRPAYERAIDLANRANREVIRNNYPAALKLARRSIDAHENFDAYYVQATVQHRLGRYDEALKSYLKAESIKPEEPQLLMSLAVLYTNRGEPEAALQRYRSLHEKNPEDPLYAFKMGTTYKLMREYESAYEYLQKADKEGFEDLDQAYIQLADTALELRKYEESEQYLQKAKAINPDLDLDELGSGDAKVAKLLEKGNDALEDKEYDRALDFFNQAAKVSPQSSGPRLLAGSVYIIQENYQMAVETLQEAVRLNPRNPRGYTLLGSALLRKQDLISAERVLKTGIEVAPENPELYNAQGLVYRDMGEIGRAIDSFYHAVKLRPDYVAARVNLSYAYLNDGRYVDAERQMNKTLEYDSNNEEIQKGLTLLEIYRTIERGDRHLSRGELDKAIEIYRRALDKDDELPLTLNALGNAHLEKKNYKKSEGFFKESLEEDGDNIAALQGLVRLYGLKGNRSAKNAYMKQLDQLSNRDVYSAITMGRTMEDEGKLEKARKYYHSLLKKNPDQQAIRGRLGYVYYKLGLRDNENEEFRRARGNFEKAEKYNPQIPLLKETQKIVRENIRFRNLLPELKKAEKLFNQEKYNRALVAYEGLYKKMKRPMVLVRIAECHINLGREDRGLEILEKARVDSPEDVEIAEAIYTFFLKKGELNRARNGFKDIISRKENAYFSHYKLGVIHLKQDEQDDAIDAFTRALIYRPDFVIANIARGVAYYQDGDEEQARAEFNEAMKKDRQSPLPHYNIGIMLYNDDMLKQAEEIFTGITKRNPDFTDARYQLSYIYFKRNNLDRAEKEMRAIIGIEPKVKYYSALAQVLEKRYESDKTPVNAGKLKAVYSELVTKFPATKEAGNARSKLSRINPNARILQPYPISRRMGESPVLVGRDLVYVDGTRVHAVDSSAKDVRWTHRAGAPVRDILVDYVIHLLTPGRVRIIDSMEGEDIVNFSVDPSATGLIGGFDQLGVITEKKRGSSIHRSLHLYDETGKLLARSDAGADARYYFNGEFFYRTRPVSEGIHIDRLSATDLTVLSSSEKPVPLPSTQNLQIQAMNSSLFVFVPGRNVQVVDSQDLELETTIETGPQVDRMITWEKGDGSRGIILPQANRIRAFDEDGDAVSDVKLSTPLFGEGSVYTEDGENFLYVGRDRKLRMVDSSGKVTWSMDLPRNSAVSAGALKAAYTLYF